MKTECNRKLLEFHPLGRRNIVGRFDGGAITSDAGGLLLRECEQATRIIRQFAGCFTDQRDAKQIEHTVEQLVGQRVYALALGYEDLNDHDALRHDPLLAALVEKLDPLGQDRKKASDRGKALAGKSTLNRLELTKEGATCSERYKKIDLNFAAAERLPVDLFLQAHPTAPLEIILDLDATDDPIHGSQEGRFFHGYYGGYCYLPLYVFCGEFLLAAKLRSSNIDASAGTLEEVARIVEQIRAKWPEVRIVLRADAGFCREPIMAWCEEHGVDYLFSLAKNTRLVSRIEKELSEAKAAFDSTRQAARVFQEFEYRTLDSWSRSRRVIAKAEHLDKGPNPRFVVTTLCDEPKKLYEEIYCARGEMENRIKEQQLSLFADRTSAATMRANQIRLWFSSVAYLLVQAVRRLALKGTEMEKAQCGTIRLKLLKIGAQVRITVRKVWVSLAEGCPYQDIFLRAHANLRRLALMNC
jgi:Transposase DDE domain group 1